MALYIAIKLKIKEKQIEIEIFIVWKYLFSIANIPKLYLLANFAKNKIKKTQIFLTIS